MEGHRVQAVSLIHQESCAERHSEIRTVQAFYGTECRSLHLGMPQTYKGVKSVCL